MHVNNMFSINEIFRSLQGEGGDTGRSAVFVRLSGCNMDCEWCDTDHSQVQLMDSATLIKSIVKEAQSSDLVVFTGGEPLLQPITSILPQLKSFGLSIGLETNGTLEVEETLFSSLSLSPKVGAKDCRIKRCHSLKILYPYMHGVTANAFEHIYAAHRYIQPILKSDDDMWNENITNAAAKEVLRLGGEWKLGLQMHKYLELR